MKQFASIAILPVIGLKGGDSKAELPVVHLYFFR